MQKSELVLNEIKFRIDNGLWASGSMIPTEAELCEMFDVSRITIRKALDTLNKEGMIRKVQGKGTFVSSVLNSGCSTEGFSEHMASIGIKVTSKLISATLELPHPEIAKKLFIKEADEKVWHFKRVRIVMDQPIAIMDSFVRKNIGDRMLEMDISDKSFFALYKEITGEKVSDNIGSVTAIIPEKQDCDLLEVEYPSAQLLYKSIAYLESGTPIQFDYSIFNSKRYAFTINTNTQPIVPISPTFP